MEEILVHLTIHGQHHRAQIAMLLRQAGQTRPLPISSFLFVRYNN
ncbi:DinB family protein [Gracilimonas sp.]